MVTLIISCFQEQHDAKVTDMPDISIINPEAMGPPLSLYGQIARVRASELIFIAGQLATDVSGRIVGKDDFDAQMKQVLSKSRFRKS